MTSSNPEINPEYIDGEVVKLLRKMPGLTANSIYFQLHYLPQVLVYGSIKRLQKSEVIGFCVVEINSFPQGEETEDHDIPPGGIENQDPQHSPRGNLRVKSCRPKGTAKTKYEYYSVYLDNTEIAYLGGGNTETTLAQRRKAEFERLVEMGIIHPDLPAEEIKRLVRGIQCRNMNV